MRERPELDERIDAALRDLVRGEAPAELAERVRARLETGGPRAWSAWRGGLAAATLSAAVVAAALLWQPGPKRAEGPSPDAARPAARAADRSPTEPETPAGPGTPVAGARVAEAIPERPAVPAEPRRRDGRRGRPAPEPGGEPGFSGVDPLPPPEPLVLAPVKAASLRIAPLAIEPVSAAEPIRLPALGEADTGEERP